MRFTSCFRYYLEDPKKAAAAEAKAKRAAQEEKKAGAETEKRRKAEEAEAKRKKMEEQRAVQARAKQAQQAQKAAKPGATISLFGFGGEPVQSVGKAASASSAKAPPGVPTIIKWQTRNDGTFGCC